MNNYIKNQHRRVWTEANGPIPNGMEIHHINSNKSDNRIENLALVTHKENCNKSDFWRKGYAHYPLNRHGNKSSRPYVAKRVGKRLGSFGTACGAFMASRMFFVNRQF
jgi:hypothetical protein